MEISRTYSSCVKGWAITMIALGNMLCHVIGIHTGEMQCNPAAYADFWRQMLTPSAPLYFIGYLHWYGVVAFIFFSGYGLTRKYGDIPAAEFTPLRFIVRHAVKIWLLMIPLMLLYFVVDHFAFGGNYTVSELVLQSLFLINIFDYAKVTPGSFWFFGMLVQFYVLFALVLRRLDVRALAALAIAGGALWWGAIMFCSPAWQQLLRHNFVGWIMPFTLGILCARCKFTFTSRKWHTIALSIAAFVLFVITANVKLLLPLSELLFLVAIIAPMRFISRPMARLGRISASVYACYSFVQLALSAWLRFDLSLTYMAPLYLCVVILVATLHHRLLAKVRVKNNPA